MYSCLITPACIVLPKNIGSLKIVPIKNAGVLVKRGNEYNKLNYDIKLKKLNLPIKKGDVIGTLTLKDKNKIVNKVNLTVKENVKKASVLELYKRSLKDVLLGSI